jgi:hypothetical protein
MPLVQGLNTAFIVSSGRTGTKFMADFFAANFNDVTSTHEPAPDFFAIGTKKFIEKRPPQRTQQSIFNARAAVIEIAKTTRCSHYIESNPNLVYILSDIDVVFPESKFVYIVRDPADTVRSMFSKSPDNSGVALFYAATDKRRRLTAKDLEDDPWHSQWHTFNRFQRICWYWQFANEQAIKFCLDNPRCLTVKYEDIFGSNSVNTLDQITHFLGLQSQQKGTFSKESTRERKNTNPEVLLEKIDKWSQEQKRQFNNILGNTRNKLGY